MTSRWDRVPSYFREMLDAAPAGNGAGGMPMSTLPDPEGAVVGPGRAGHAHVVSSRGQAEDLVAWLLSPHRDRVAVVIMSSGPLPDLSALAAHLGEGVETYAVDDERISHTVNQHLPDGLKVHGDAARIFPPRPARQLHRAPLLTHDRRAETLERQLASRVAIMLSEDPRESAPSLRMSPRPASGSPPGSASLATGQDRAARSPSAAAAFASADGTVQQVTTFTGGRDLVRFLLDERRREPVVVISIHPDEAAPFFDAAHIAEELQGVAAVVLIDADATYGLTDGFGDRRLSVFLGAARLYPVGRNWRDDMYEAPLYLCLSRRQAHRRTRELMGAALASAHAAGLFTTEAPPPGAERVTVKVRSPFGSNHVLVATPDGRSAAMLVAKLAVGVEPQRLIGSRIPGSLVFGSGILGEFSPDPPTDEALARAQSAFPDGTMTMARITGVRDGGPEALLHPMVPIRILGEEDLSLVVTAGDTVGVEVVWEDGEAIGALLADPAADELAPALGIVPGGPPWLVPADLAFEPPVEVAPSEPAAAPEQASAIPSSAPDLSEAGGAERQAQAREATALLAAQVEQLQAELDESRGRERHLKRQLRRATGKRAREAAVVWRDPERQLRHEIDQAYLHRIDEDERNTWRLPQRYEVGPGFIDSMDRLQGISRDKILDVVVEVLTGLDERIPARERRPWLTRRGGPREERDDGARAWRVNLQSNAPGARRLKYWTTPDRVIELDSVGHHDDGISSN